jgi:hypothetical protein
MSLQGYQLYNESLKNKIKLPDNYEGYSFHSYNTQPLPTENLSAANILKLRDEKFIEYHTNDAFLKRIKEKFGDKALTNILLMTKVKLKRKIIQENEITLKND